MNKEIHIIGGGTINTISNHLSVCAPAYGSTSRFLNHLCKDVFDGKMVVHKHLTRMAGGAYLETTEDIDLLVEDLIQNPKTKIIFMTAAICDYEPLLLEANNKFITEFNRSYRLKTAESQAIKLFLSPAQKIVSKIRKDRN